MWQDDALYEVPLEDEAHISVLVAVVPSQADWQRICDEHWYRIPLKRAPKRIGARYIAFYHTQACRDLRWAIHYYAQVEGYRLATRRELIPDQADHPRADERYYCLSLGLLQQLARPIPSIRLRRITFISTTLQRLLAAREINDLWLPNSNQSRYGRAYDVSKSQLGEAKVPYRLTLKHTGAQPIQP